jgi:hypothetical protein
MARADQREILPTIVAAASAVISPTSWHVQAILRRLGDVRFAGIDVVEVAPAYAEAAGKLPPRVRPAEPTVGSCAIVALRLFDVAYAIDLVRAEAVLSERARSSRRSGRTPCRPRRRTLVCGRSDWRWSRWQSRCAGKEVQAAATAKLSVGAIAIALEAPIADERWGTFVCNEVRPRFPAYRSRSECRIERVDVEAQVGRCLPHHVVHTLRRRAVRTVTPWSSVQSPTSRCWAASLSAHPLDTDVTEGPGLVLHPLPGLGMRGAVPRRR